MKMLSRDEIDKLLNRENKKIPTPEDVELLTSVINKRKEALGLNKNEKMTLDEYEKIVKELGFEHLGFRFDV